MPKREGPLKKTAATKKAAAGKQGAASGGVQIKIDLGTLNASEAQICRLKAYLENQLLTWVRCDLGNDPAPPILASEFKAPPPGQS